VVPEFYQNRWMHRCGTPSCTLGWATEACPEVFSFEEEYDDDWYPAIHTDDILVNGDVEDDGNHWAAAAGFLLSQAAGTYVCEAGGASVGGRHVPYRYIPNTLLDPIYREEGLKGSLRRLDRLIEYQRRKLAIAEVEQDEWGKQLPARDIPVGEARRELLMA